MTDEPIKRGRGRPRKPRPDNPPPKRAAGRPKEARVAERLMSVREYAMTHVFDAIDVWAEIMKDKDQPGAARAAASAHVVNRAVGQPTQAIEHTGKNGGPIETRNYDNAPPEVLEWLAGQDVGETMQ